MSQIEAIFQDGVFKPLGQVALSQNQRVRLTVEAMPRGDVLTWLEEVRKGHATMIAARGYLSDSTPGIA